MALVDVLAISGLVRVSINVSKWLNSLWKRASLIYLFVFSTTRSSLISHTAKLLNMMDTWNICKKSNWILSFIHYCSWLVLKKHFRMLSHFLDALKSIWNEKIISFEATLKSRFQRHFRSQKEAAPEDGDCCCCEKEEGIWLETSIRDRDWTAYL